MTITGQNFEMFAGDSKEIEIAVVDENGAALDLTPYDAINWVVYKPTTKEIVLSKTLGSGITVAAPLTGIITISLVPADTENIFPMIYAHECEINSGTSVVSTVCTGTMKIVYSKA
jgi:hypothetical protein